MKEVSNRGVAEIASHEGLVPAPYLDSVGVWTFGVGHTAAAGGLDPKTMPKGNPAPGADMDRAIALALHTFRKDLKKYETRVNRALRVTVTQAEFDALVSFDFNTGGIFRAKLTKAINEGKVDASKRFMGWLRPPEIRSRREAEMDLFETGVYGRPGKISVWSVSSAGKLLGITHRYAPAELLRLMDMDEAEDVEVLEPKTPEKPRKEKKTWAAILGFFTKVAEVLVAWRK